MLEKFSGGKVPERAPEPAEMRGRVEVVLKDYDALDFAGALSEVWADVRGLNQAIDKFAPWKVAKDPARSGELQAFLYRLAEGVRLATVLVAPVMPTAANRIFNMMGIEPHTLGRKDLEWGGLVPGRPLGKVEPVFPRIEKEKPKVSETPTPSAAGAAPAEPTNLIDIAEFGRVELAVAQIEAAEAIPKSKKLIKLQVDLGTEKRQVVAGIAEAYTPEALVGRKVALVTNLKPAMLMGVASNGMVLAASLDGKPSLLSVDASVPPGTRIK
jgi:methionyl-tRNA synthetase